MATNKRTDSAALFELIDKSTLKVPKNGGSLKIPSWWSSKTNPVAPTPVPAAPAPLERSPQFASPSPTISPNGKALNGTATDAPAPSIRPPARPIVPAPVKRPSSGIFAPQTYDQSAPQQRQTRGAPPLWLILAGGGACLIILICFAVVIFRASHTPAPNSHVGPDPTPKVVTNFIPVPDNANPGPEVNPGTNINPPQQQTPNPGQPRIVPFNEVKRTPGYYYLFIVTAPEKIAMANAQYLADHGISTSIRGSPTSPNLYEVISVDGFPSLDEGKAYRTQIAALGRAHPDAKKTGKGVYDSAYFKRVARPQ